MKINQSVSNRLGDIAQQLRLMNGKYPSGEPQVGELIKKIETASGGISAGLVFDRLGG